MHRPGRMESPSKRLKMSPHTLSTQDDFVPLGEEDGTFGYANSAAEGHKYSSKAPEGPRADRDRYSHHGHDRISHDSRNARDKPRSKHIMPGYEPWLLIRTKYRRRFVHNTQTKQSLWHIPKDVMPGVFELEKWEKEQKEKAQNAKWAEEQLKQMREQSHAEEINKSADTEGKHRRRRSESLQREDEAALMAELAAQAEHAEEQDAKQAAEAVQDLHSRAQDVGLESDSEYEVVEVTDTEGEDDREDEDGRTRDIGLAAQQSEVPEPHQQQAGPVEFGEEDIAYQLAAMGEDYGLDPGEYGDDYDGEWEEGAEGLPLSDEDAINLFRDLLDDYQVSPFMPWDRLVTDESDSSILNDDRYTVLPNMRSRKEVFDSWARDKAAQLKEQRAAMEKRDPKIPYLAFLQENANPKLYWPEFKRKFKKEPELNDRKLSDKDREKLYRDHINRLRLPESTRKADLQALLKSVPLNALHRDTRLESLPQQLLSNLHFISILPSVRDPIIASYIRTLSTPPDLNDVTDEQRAEEDNK